MALDKEKYLDFERPILELEEKVQALRNSTRDGGIESLAPEIRELESKLDSALRELSARLSPWQRAQLARHPMRPGTADLASRIFTDVCILHGDRHFSDDQAITCALARLNGREVLLVMQQKGREPQERVRHNFGMAHPDGYRKVMRLTELAERFGRPVITLVDTLGAYPGIGAEERGQAWAVAASIETFLNLRVPSIAVVVGEGGSGGALAIAVTDRVFMLENAIYSVISAEGCASILFRDAARAPEAAAALKITAQNAFELGVIDGIIQEPPGGAHRNWDDAARRLGEALEKALAELQGFEIDNLLQKRFAKFRALGRVSEG